MLIRRWILSTNKAMFQAMMGTFLLHYLELLLQCFGLLGPKIDAFGVVKLQAQWRKILARNRIAARLQARDEMIALPGTCRGESGWYELIVQHVPMVVKYERTEENSWKLVLAPMTKSLYIEAVKASKMIPASEVQDDAVVQGFALIAGVRRLQAHARKHLARVNVMRELGGKMLSMPGTILGKAGWYEFLSGEEEKRMVVWCGGQVDEWEIVAEPMSRKMYTKAVGFAVKNSQARQVTKRRVSIKLPPRPPKRRFDLGSQRNLAEMARRRITPPRAGVALLSQARSALLRAQ